MSSRAVVIAAALLAAGCGSTSTTPTLGPVAAYSASPAAGDTGALKRLRSLEIPRTARLTLRPVRFAGSLHPATDAPRDEVPLHIVIRARHADHTVTQWVVTRGNRPDGSMPVRPVVMPGRYVIELGGQRLGPIRADDLTALEVFVSRLTAEAPAHAAHGGAALADAPAPNLASRRARAAYEGAARARGAELQLAVAVPVVSLDKTPEAARAAAGRTWLVLVEAEPPGDQAERLDGVAKLSPVRQRLDPPVADAGGAGIPKTSALWLAVEIDVVDAPGPPPPPGEERNKRKKRRDERRKRPRAVAAHADVTER